ncbi:MAG TPA: DNA methyltransferase, partial [Gemmatimonadales bacterium]|nr:DNA methyltransferase [Gemmatimonadales bacterium]
MDRDALHRALPAVYSPRDIGSVFAALGYAPCWDTLDQHSHIVARWGAFRVVAPDQPGRDALRTLVSSMARAGNRALAAGVDATGLILSAPRLGTGAGTRLLAIPRDDPPRLALQLVEELHPRPRDTALTLTLRSADVLSSEAAGRQFFAAFRSLLDRMAAVLPPDASLAERQMAALLQLTRVLFLYFVQAKGWLAGRPYFLRETLDQALASGIAFHRRILQPLFFGTLNRPVPERTGPFRQAAIPYLNGGLFEVHPVERRWGRIAFPNELWRDAFDQVFERFRFCVREAEEVNAIAPDMLGHVFERVMDHEERHATGTFYTPEPVVKQLVGAAVETALTDRQGIHPQLAARVVAGEQVTPQEARRLTAALRRLRILDPAVGSGAFLLVALESLVDLRAGLHGQADRARRQRWRREILRRNLFGVDRSPLAVRLAELRLWLAVIADDPADSPADVAPLPNLDGVVRQGDSLHDTLGAVGALTGLADLIPLRAPGTAAVTRARTALFDATGRSGRRAAKHLRAVELQWARCTIDAALSRV